MAALPLDPVSSCAMLCESSLLFGDLWTKRGLFGAELGRLRGCKVGSNGVADCVVSGEGRLWDSEGLLGGPSVVRVQGGSKNSVNHGFSQPSPREKNRSLLFCESHSPQSAQSCSRRVGLLRTIVGAVSDYCGTIVAIVGLLCV